VKTAEPRWVRPFPFRSGRRELDSATAYHEVHDEGDDGKDQKQMDEETCALEHDETTKPRDDEDDCENQKHGKTFLLVRVYRAGREPVLLLRAKGLSFRCSDARIRGNLFFDMKKRTPCEVRFR
jgi:hypothetical protein